ncbi:alpha/beta hydrolase [Streptacidiphilus sp. 4-A2]|nr:alpha/beta hydrolase [Streptacidiphilus sp. 4-A2]
MDATAAVVRTAINSTSCVSERLAGKGAFSLFRNPMGHSKLRPSERPFMEQAQVKALDLNGKTVLSYRWGSGERPVLLVHGWESRGSRFSAFAAELLERGYSPVTFDAPGTATPPARPPPSWSTATSSPGCTPNSATSRR